MSYMNSATLFKNEPSRRFYLFYNSKFDSKELKKKEVGEQFGFAQSRGFSFWRDLKAGTTGVSVEQILIGMKEHNLNPKWLFGFSEKRELPDDETVYPSGYIMDSSMEQNVVVTPSSVGSVIDFVLDKHRIKRQEYAEQQLKMSLRNLQKIISGDVNVYFSTVKKIAEDMGESLDLFRGGQFPKGHLLALLQQKDEHIQALQQTVSSMQQLLDAKQL